MIKIVGVRFRNTGKVYYFAPKDLEIKAGDQVIVETARGTECGRVVLSPREVTDDRVVQPLREVVRMATEKDVEREAENRQKEKEAYKICQQKIREHNLDMKLIQAEYTFDNKKVLFYFTSDGRVDFRDLVKDLASVFKTRIELRQIGVRDETKLLGGIGICGRALCCSTYLSDFAPVSIKMAKEQNLSLNPTKISGVCGRLLCCLKNEQETYEYLNKNLPGNGDLVTTDDGREGEIQSVNVLRQTVRVLIEEGDNKEIEEYPASEITVRVKRRNRHRDKEGKKENTVNNEAREQAGEIKKQPAESGAEGKQEEKRGGRENTRHRDKSRREGKREGDKAENRESGEKKREGRRHRRRNNRHEHGDSSSAPEK